MRRRDFHVTDESTMNTIMTNAGVGHLGIIDSNGYPRIVPLNYVYADDRVYFHGAMDGEKFYLLSESPKVTFSVDIPHSIIPSYWIAKDYACPASTFFQSVHIRGRGQVIESTKDKARFLQLFMEKYQPEGGYKAIDDSDPLYRKGLEETVVFEVLPEQVDIKSKFGQNLSSKQREELIEKLTERNIGMDIQTAQEIRKAMTEES